MKTPLPLNSQAGASRQSNKFSTRKEFFFCLNKAPHAHSFQRNLENVQLQWVQILGLLAY